MKSSKMNKMKKRLLALLLCMVMMMNGSVSALASEVTASDEVNAISQDAGTQTASLETVHEHTGECYSRSKVSDALICGKEVVEGHTHGDACYEVTNTPECICTLEETAGHSHDEGCYTTVETKNCSLEEHTHGDGCYTTEFTCGTEEHSHGDECFTTETINVCGQEEVEAHTHGDGCYTTVENKTLTCELEEAEGHAHSDECYEWTEELTCTIPAETPTVEPEITICEVCGKEECECEAEIEICEVCGKETCECEAEEEAEPITLTTEVDGTTITLSGPAEAFTEGMVYSIEATVVEAEQEVEVIEEVLEEVAEEQEKTVKNYQAFDIKIIESDAEGNVTNDNFQPLNKTPVMVTFSSKEVAESVANEETETSVLHVDTEKKEAEDMAAEVTEDKDVAIETTHFSIYVYVELEEIGEITLTIEHWVEGADDKLYEDSELVLENGFKGTIEELVDACIEDLANVGYKVSEVFEDVDGTWFELDGEIVLTKDTRIKIEYTFDSEASGFNGYSMKKSAPAGKKIDKTATELVNDFTDVTLSVPGEAQDYSSDIVMIIGRGPSSDYDYLIETIRKMLKASDGTSTEIKLGLVTFGDTTEKETILPLTVMDEETMDEVIAEACQRTYTNYSGINLESALVTARDMLAADEDIPAERKHMIVVSTGLTYWFDDVDGSPAFTLRSDSAGRPQHLDFSRWREHRHGSTGISGYPIPDGYKVVDSNGNVDWRASWEDYWEDIVSWVEKDQDTYVYSVRDTYTAFAGRLKSRLIVDEEDKARIRAMLPYQNGANPKTKESAQHAAGYERAQYDAWVVYNQMQTPIGERFETAFKDGNGNKVFVEGLGFNCYAIANGMTSNPGEEDVWLQSNGIGYNFMRMLGGENCVNWRDHADFFKPIENKILYACSIGSTVEDYIGYDEEKGNFEFVQDPDVISLKVGEEVYTTTQTYMADNQKSSSYAFAKEGAEPTFWLDYEYGNGTTTEKFTWRFGENVSRYVPVSLTYKLKLIDKAEEEGTYVVNTNISATLYPVDSNGKSGEPQIFPVPDVSYEVVNKKLIRIKKVDSSTGENQTPLAGAEFTLYDNLGNQVLTVPATDAQGIAEFEVGLGEYILKETKAPDGYLLFDTEIKISYSKEEFSVEGALNVNPLADETTVEVTIANIPVYELPSTGGYGSCLYTLSGAVLMLGSSLMKYKKKREEVPGSDK